MAARMNMTNNTNTTSVDNSLLLDPADENESDLQDALYQKLILQAAAAGGLDIPGGLDGSQEPQATFTKVTPEPGFCIKTRDDKGVKIFINICKTDNIPPAKDITDEELAIVLESDEPDYRIPMSIADPHAEVDKGGKGVTAYDIAINTSLHDRILSSDLFRGFFMTVVYEALENKYGILMDRNWVQLKNKKSFGVLTEHHIRRKSKPRISEVDRLEEAPSSTDNTPSTTKASKPLITELNSSNSVTSKAPPPDYVIMREPIEGYPEFLVAEVQLPKVKSAKLLSLDLGEDHIVLHAHPNLYYLDIYLPFNILHEDSGAQFNRDNKVLTLTLPVHPL